MVSITIPNQIYSWLRYLNMWRRNLKKKLDNRYSYLINKLPSDLNFETTTHCNLNCIYCGREHLLKNGVVKPEHMSSSLIEKVIDEFAEISREVVGDVSVCPVGLGEPLLDPNFFNTVSIIRERIPGANIHANTNGVLINEENIQKIVSSELDLLVISINVRSRDNYIALHKSDNFDLVRNNIVRLMNVVKNNGPKIVPQFLDIDLNKSCKENIVSLRSTILDPAHYGNNKTYHPVSSRIRQMMSTKELDKYMALLGNEDTKLLKKKHPCYSLFSGCAVDKDGYIYPCCMGYWCRHTSDICLGNINDTSIREVFEKKDGRLHELRQLHLQGRWDEIDACRTCTGGRTESSMNIFFKVGNRWI